jgi:hypothetical protein
MREVRPLCPHIEGRDQRSSVDRIEIHQIQIHRLCIERKEDGKLILKKARFFKSSSTGDYINLESPTKSSLVKVETVSKRLYSRDTK